jgi:hypothetical protein
MTMRFNKKKRRICNPGYAAFFPAPLLYTPSRLSSRGARFFGRRRISPRWWNTKTETTLIWKNTVRNSSFRDLIKCEDLFYLYRNQ